VFRSASRLRGGKGKALVEQTHLLDEAQTHQRKNAVFSLKGGGLSLPVVDACDNFEFYGDA